MLWNQCASKMWPRYGICRYALLMLARRSMITRLGVFLSDSSSLELWLSDTICTSLSRMGFWPRRRRRLVLSLARKGSEFWLEFSNRPIADSKCFLNHSPKVWQIYCRESLWGRERWGLKPFRRYWYLSLEIERWLEASGRLRNPDGLD